MKKLIICSLLATAFTLVGAELKFPAFRMTEPELLAVLKENSLNDKVTACQELSHKGSEAAIPLLAALLKDDTPPALFLAARSALENFPQPAAEAALKNALATVKNAQRRQGLEVSLKTRTTPFVPGYVGAAKEITAFPPPTPVQKGDLSTVPALVEQALGSGFAAQFAQRQLVGFPNAGVVAKMLELINGTDVKRAKLAIGVIGQRRERACLPKLLAAARTTRQDTIRGEIFKAFATLCGPQDVPTLLALLKEQPNEERLSAALVRICSREFTADSVPINVIEALYSPDPLPQDNGKTPCANVKVMVSSLVKGGSRTIMASNRLAGHGGFAYDPAPGRVKFLRLKYSVDGGPVIQTVTRESEEIELAGVVLPETLAKVLVDTTRTATGAYRATLVEMLKALEKRGRVPGSDAVLFRPIFNGKDLTGWTQKDGYFTVKDGVILGASTPEHLCKPNHHLVYTAETLTDFELRAEFKLSRGANSGIQLRCKPQFIGDNGYQADMNGGGDFVGFIYHPRQHLVGQRGADVSIAADGKKSVKVFADAKELQKLYKVEQWNDIRVKVEGRTITVWINGVKTTSIVDPREEFFLSKGHIALQLHQGPPMTVEYRNLRIR